jgi:CubicO group peptidase (beta-lactamase class C family)
MRLPGLPKSRPEDVGLDSDVLVKHSIANQCHIDAGLSTGVAECAIKKNRLVYTDIRGKQDVELRLPMTGRSLHRCYSMTKPITAFGLLVLWEDGKLNLDDPVEKYIPEFKQMKVVKNYSLLEKGERGGLVNAKRPVTLRHLVTHTAGLAYGPSRDDRSQPLKPTRNPIKRQYAGLVRRVDSGEVSSLAELCRELAKQPLCFQPGQGWEYSYGMDVIGRVLEVASGMPLDRFLKERVFLPVGMLDTAFFVQPQKAKRQLAAYYIVNKRFRRIRCDGRRPEQSAWVTGQVARIFGGGGSISSADGGLLSSLRDQALFANMLANMGYAHATKTQVLKPATVRAGCRDWLGLKSVSAGKSLKGWHDGRRKTKLGWSPLGIREGDFLFMGGMGSWSVNFRSKTVVVQFPNSSWDEKLYPNWKDEVDDLECAVKKSEELAKSKERIYGKRKSVDGFSSASSTTSSSSSQDSKKRKTC